MWNEYTPVDVIFNTILLYVIWNSTIYNNKVVNSIQLIMDTIQSMDACRMDIASFVYLLKNLYGSRYDTFELINKHKVRRSKEVDRVVDCMSQAIRGVTMC